MPYYREGQIEAAARKRGFASAEAWVRELARERYFGGDDLYTLSKSLSIVAVARLDDSQLMTALVMIKHVAKEQWLRSDWLNFLVSLPETVKWAIHLRAINHLHAQGLQIYKEDGPSRRKSHEH